MYYVYVILCKNRTFYTGYAQNLMKRIKQHIEGKGARYLRGNKVKKLYYVEKYRSQRRAIQREREIKKLSHKEKKKLIERSFDGECRAFDGELVEDINKTLGLF